MTSTSQNSGGGQLHLLFIRHGETQDNIDKILQGWRDTNLTEKGHQEAKILAQKILEEDIKIDVMYHSPLIRIKQTIAPILETRPGVETFADPDLRGQGLGDFEGGSYDLVDMSNPRSADDKPGVETFDNFVGRVKRSVGKIVGIEAPKVGQGGKNRFVGIATHGVGITAFIKALEATPQCDNFNPKIATRGPEAYEVRWTDSDDVARIIVDKPEDLPIRNGELQWEEIQGEPFLIDRWGKKEKRLS